MKTERTQSADRDCFLNPKPPEQASKRTLSRELNSSLKSFLRCCYVSGNLSAKKHFQGHFSAFFEKLNSSFYLFNTTQILFELCVQSCNLTVFIVLRHNYTAFCRKVSRREEMKRREREEEEEEEGRLERLGRGWYSEHYVRLQTGPVWQGVLM